VLNAQETTFRAKAPMMFEASMSQFHGELEAWRKVFIDKRAAAVKVFIIAYGTKHEMLE